MYKAKTQFNKEHVVQRFWEEGTPHVINYYNSVVNTNTVSSIPTNRCNRRTTRIPRPLPKRPAAA